MTAYSGMSKKIKNALVTILQGIQYDAGGGPEPAFVSVLDNTKDEFEGYPSVRILPNQMSSTSATLSQFDHEVNYTLIVSWEFESTLDIEQDIYNRMYDTTDLIEDTLEHGDYHGQLSSIDPTIQAWMMNVPQVRWYLAESKVGVALIAEVIVKVTYMKDAF